MAGSHESAQADLPLAPVEESIDEHRLLRNVRAAEEHRARLGECAAGRPEAEGGGEDEWLRRSLLAGLQSMWSQRDEAFARDSEASTAVRPTATTGRVREAGGL